LGIALDVLRRLSSNLVRCIDVPTKTEPEQKQNINCFMIYSSISEGGEGGVAHRLSLSVFVTALGWVLVAVLGARVTRRTFGVWTWSMDLFFFAFKFRLRNVLRGDNTGGHNNIGQIPLGLTVHSSPVKCFRAICARFVRQCFACGITAVRHNKVLVRCLRCRAVSYGFVRCRIFPVRRTCGAVRWLVRSPVRVSRGVRTQPRPHSTFGAPPSPSG
jgi:hypothetical protein